jgi:hypothetical protein
MVRRLAKEVLGSLMSYDENRTGRFANHVLRSAAKHEASNPAAAVRAHHDEVHILFPRAGDDLGGRVSFTHHLLNMQRGRQPHPGDGKKALGLLFGAVIGIGMREKPKRFQLLLRVDDV